MAITSPPAVLPSATGAPNYEDENVHEVYEQIASHFSSTRYQAWPIIKSFILALPSGSIGLDVGCGNGKYMLLRQDIFILGSDHSTNLVKIAKKHQPHDVLVCDNLALPHSNAEEGGIKSGPRQGRFDFAISIAVIHHLSTSERRRQAIRCILDCLRDGGEAMIYAWALEQKDSRRGWDENSEQDIMVPWVMKTPKQKLENGEVIEAKEETKYRYYHLFRKGELEADIIAAGGEVANAGYEKDNWWAVARPVRLLSSSRPQ